ncbi:MAG: hypothetical protein IK032_07785 [Bacteroidales bacterium]|nr:hypothetical protein [Bacteroidales bacterium]MBR5028155.1 hypothetical protein [Bacteroidales bacterium]
METTTGQNVKKTDMDTQRKRALAAVCQYLEAMDCREFLGKDYPGRIAYAKGVICRAAKVENGSFNRIGKVRLRALTAMFNKMHRDMDGVVRESYKALGV